MRVLIDATPLETGHRLRGIGTYTRELLRALLRLDRENEYRLIVHDREARGLRDALAGALSANSRPLYLPRPRLGRLTALVTHQMLLPLLLARQQADLFHAPGFVAALSVPGIPWHCPLPLVVTVHDFIPLHIPALFNNKALNRWWYERQMRLASRADLLICVSEATRQDALRFLGISPDRCVVIHEGVSRQVFHPPAARTEPVEPPFILFVGGEFPNKNREAALAAFSRLIQESQLPHHLVLVGQGSRPAERLQQRHPHLDLNRVHWLAAVSQEELARLYREADVLLFPSICEGFGLPVLEAMASGTPVIASNVSALPEVVGDAGILIDPQDVNGIVAALQQLLSDRELQQQLIDAGLERAKAFTWERMARETLAAYRRLAGSTN